MFLRLVFPGVQSLPFFYEPLRHNDLSIIARQMRERRFNPALLSGTADRCRFGCPRVVLCSPLQKFLPFPTSFWLTCPWLLRAAGTVESHGGVAKLESWIKQNAPSEWVPFNMAHQLLRLALLPVTTSHFLRRYRPWLYERLRSAGVGGIRYRESRVSRAIHVKCIHLQVASWLAFGYHPGAPWLERNGLKEDCGGGMCEMCEGAAQGKEGTDDVAGTL
jgi:hypothetical protein